MKKFLTRFNFVKVHIAVLGLILVLVTNSLQAQVNITPLHDGTTTTFTTWTHTSCLQGVSSGNNYVQMIASASLIRTPVLNFDRYTLEQLTFKARTFGSPTNAQATITVSISTNNGSTWTLLGTRLPTSTTLITQTSFDVSPYSGTQILIKFETLGAGSSKGIGIDDISLTGTESAVLSVEMKWITAVRKGTQNIIEWQTATETNTAHFNIERFENGLSNWKIIGTIKASGNSQTTKSYQHTDEGPLSISYYRLRSVDFDGKEQVSNIVSVQQNKAGKLNIVPTKTSDKLLVSTDNDYVQTYNVFDLLGRSVLTGQMRGQKELFVNTLVSGTYILTVGTEIAKFMKQ